MRTLWLWWDKHWQLVIGALGLATAVLLFFRHDKETLAWVGVGVEALAAIYYFIQTIIGEVSPHPISWFGWTTVGAVATKAAYDAGAGPGFYVAASFVGVTASILVAALIKWRQRKRGSWRQHRLELMIGLGGLVVLIASFFHGLSTNLSATLGVAGDMFFAFLTLRQAWRWPEWESRLGWWGGTLASALGVLALESYSYPASVYLWYVLGGDLAIASAVSLARLRDDYGVSWIPRPKGRDPIPEREAEVVHTGKGRGA